VTAPVRAQRACAHDSNTITQLFIGRAVLTSSHENAQVFYRRSSTHLTLLYYYYFIPSHKSYHETINPHDGVELSEHNANETRQTLELIVFFC
jgi:hypothetical protein